MIGSAPQADGDPMLIELMVRTMSRDPRITEGADFELSLATSPARDCGGDRRARSDEC
jgi:hypothetical protein